MPEKTEVMLGGTKRFECRVIGYPRPDIKWYKDGVEITSNSRYNFTFSREGVISMLIEKVSRQDEGCYRCRASNSEGMASTAAYLFVRTKKSKFLDDIPSVHSMSFVQATEEDLEHDREFKSKQIKQREEIEAMETEEYEERMTIEEQSDILKGREPAVDIYDGSSDQHGVTLTEVTALSEDSGSSWSSLEEIKGTKDTQVKLEKMAKMYEEIIDESSQKEEKISFEMESETVTKMEVSGKSDLTVESEVSIEERKSKKIEISSEESVTKEEISMMSSVTKETQETTEEKHKLEEEIRKKEEQLSELIMQESTEESESPDSARLDVSVDIDETKLSTQTADDSGLGISFTADMEERSFTVQDDSLLASSSVETESSETKNVEITTEVTETTTKQEESTDIISVEITGCKETEQTDAIKISAVTDTETSKENDQLSFETSISTDSIKSQRPDLVISAEIETEEKITEVLKLEKEKEEELLEKKTEETESLHGEMNPESLLSERVATPQDLVLPRIGVAEYKAEELGEQQSVSSVEDLSSEHFTEPKTTADDYFGDKDLVLPTVKQLPVYKTEEMKDQLSEGSVEDLPLDETSQSESDVKIEKQPVAAEAEIVESLVDIREGPPEPEMSNLPESTSEQAAISLGPDSGIFDMSLRDTEFQVEELEVVGSSVDRVEHLAAGEASKVKEGMAEEVERVPTFVSFDQHVSESEIGKITASSESLQETEATFVSKAEEEIFEAKKTQDVYMTDGLTKEKTPVDEVQDLGTGDTDNIITADVKVEEGARQQMVKQPSIEALIEQASLDDIAALADLQTIVGEEKSQAGESSADGAEGKMASKEHAVESQSEIISEITRSEDNLSEISEALQPAEVSESKQSEEMESERAHVMPDELILQADANVKNAEEKQAGDRDAVLADIEVNIEDQDKKGDDTLVLQADVSVSEEKYDTGEGRLNMSATVDSNQVRSIPKVTRVPEDVSVQPGETIHLTSEVQGSPAPEVKWFKEGDTVKATERISLITDNDVYTLEIREATGADAGTYTLTAHNSEGTIFSDVQVTVNIPREEGAAGGATGGEEVSVTAILTSPEFVIKPEDVSVQEFEQIKLVCSVKGTPTPEVKWQREGRTLKADNRMRIFESDGCHYLEIPQASFMDSGEYECIATNSEGTVSVVIRLTVEGVTDIDESGLSTNEELRMAMSERSDTDDNFLRIYVVVTEHMDESTNVTLNVGEVVEVLNSTLHTGNWLVRKTTDKEQVAYIPSSSLKGQEIQLSVQEETNGSAARRRERRLSRSPSQRSTEVEPGDTSDDEGLFSRREGFPVYVVIADFTPGEGETDSLRLSEGQYVEVLDMQKADQWLVKTKPTKTTPAKEGWVPSAYLNLKMLGTTVSKRSTTEQFREEIIQISNKQQESLLKRRYAVTELLETEREYIRQLKHLIKEYQGRLGDKDVPEVLRNKKDIIFANIQQIQQFHEDVFLASLSSCAAMPQNVGSVFLQKRDEFMQYVEYLCQRETVDYFLETEEAREFLKEYSTTIKDSESALKSYLMKPLERLITYRTFLQDYLRYTSRAGQECADAEAAIAMLYEITNMVQQVQILGQVEGFTGDIQQNGTMLRHDDFLMWDVPNPTLSRGKERHLFLFGDKLILTKRKKPDMPTDTATYAFKSLVELQNVQVNETVIEDDRRFELWYAEPTSEKLTFQAKNIYAKQAWVREIREALKKLGIQETDIMPDRRGESSPKRSLVENGSKDEVDRGNDSGSESDRTQDFVSLSSYETDPSSYHTAHEFEDGTSMPFFRRRPRKIVCTEGSTAKLDCIVGGNPLPTVSWLISNTQVEETANRKYIVEGDNCSLVFREVTKSEGGQYTAKATNVNGSIVSTTELVVLEEFKEQEGVSEPTSGAVSPEPTEKVEQEPVKESAAEPDKEPVLEPAKEPTPEPVKEPTPEPVKEPTPEPVKEPTPEPVKEPTPEPVEEPTPEPIKEPTPEPVKEPTPEPVKEPTPEPVKESTPEPVKEPSPEPVKEPTPEPVKEPTPEPVKKSIPESVREPTPEPVKEPTPEQVKEPTPEPVKEPTPEPIKETTTEPVKAPTPEPVKQPISEPVKEVTPEPVKEPTPEPVIESKPEPIKEPSAESVKEPTQEPVKELTQEPSEETLPQPVKDLASEPVTEPTQEPVKEPESVKEPSSEPVKDLITEPVKGPDSVKESTPVKEPTLEQVREPTPEKVNEPPAKPLKETEPAKDLTEEPSPEAVTELVEKQKKPTPEVVKEQKPLKEPQVESVKEAAPTEELTTEASKEPEVKETVKTEESEAGELKEESGPKGSAPVFIEEMKDIKTEIGQLVRFDCRVCAYPDPEITWMKDGKKLKESEKFKLINTNNDIFSLLIKDVKVQDSGRYQCVARNEYGEAITEALLNVIALGAREEEDLMAPRFTTKFYDINTLEGVPVDFSCIYEGKPEPDVAWLINGEKITKELNFDAEMKSDGKQASLVFKLAQTYHTGEITCRLRNVAGEAKCRAWLNVKEDPKKRGTKPEFEERPRDADTRECEDATFEAVVSGDPAPEVTWYFKGRELFESKRRDIRRVGNTHTLVVKDVVPANEGEYTCRAKNPAGEVSCQAWLTVLAPKKREPSPPIFREVPPEKIKPYGFPPSFTRRIVDTIAPPGGSARFECRSIGVPDPRVEWKKDGQPITTGPKFTIGKEGDTHYLVINNADNDDMGEFECIISNDAGTATSLARLRVKEEKEKAYSPARVILPDYAPSYAVKELAAEENIPSMPFDKPALLDVKPDSVKLTWLPAYTSDLSPSSGPVSYIVEARELPSMRWTRLTSDLQATQYSVKGLSPDKEYNFRVRAENKYGSSEPTLPAVLEKRKEPKKKEQFDVDEYIAAPYLPTTKPYITDMGTETVRLAWEPAHIPTDRYDVPPVSYRLEAQELPREDWVPLVSRVFDPNAYLTELAPDRDYNIRVRAENKYGISEPSDSIWLPRARAFPGVPISRPQIVEIEPEAVRLNWRRVDIPTFETDDTPLRYMIEMNEPPSSRWTQVAGGIPDTTYVISDLVPGRDYRFRVRSESPEGIPGEPSPATSLYRTLALSRIPVDALEIEDYEPDYEAVRLSWRRVEVPPYARDEDHLTYMIEGSEPGVDDWRPLVSGIPGTTYRLSDIGPTQDYRFRVRGITPYGVSPPSYPASMTRTVAPIRPLTEGVKMSEIHPDSVRLSWKPLTLPEDYQTVSPIRYQIDMQETPRLDWQPIARDIPDTSYLVTGLTPGRDYSFRVRPMGILTDVEPYPTATLTSFPVKPRLPIRQPIMSELGLDSVRLSWRPAELPMYTRRPIPVTYTVEMQEVPTSTWLTVARRIPDTMFTVNGLRPDKEYIFRIRPETEYGPGESSIPIRLFRKPVLSLPAREPRISDINADSILLSWEPVTVPKGASLETPVTYRIESKEPTGGTWMPIATHIPTNRYTVRFLNPDRGYMFRVIAEADGVLSEPSPGVYLPHRASPPRMPREMPYAFNILPDSMTLSWRCVELPSRITDYSPVSYRIEMIDSPGGDWKLHSRDVPKTQAHLTGLRPDRDYSFRVRAENDFGVGEPTDPVVVRRRAVPPSLPQEEPLMSDIRPGSLRLSWRPAEMPSYVRDHIPVTYTILFQDLPDTNWRPLVRRIPDNTYHIFGLNPDRDYCFRVQAENDYGMSSPTMPVRLSRYSDIRGPIEIPEFEDYEPSNLRLAWKRPQHDPYAHKPVTYTIETYKPKERTWTPYVSKLPEPSYRLTDIDRYRDHMFRIRIETDGGLSEPSIPVSYSPRRVMPRVPVEKPEIYDIHGDSVRVSWRPVYIPSFTPTDLRYRLELRELPSTHWRTLVPNTSDLSYQVTGLRPKQDYAFRVRAITDDGPSEPSYPAYLYRKPAIPYIPFSSPEIEDVEDTSVKLRWHLVDIPAFEYEDEPLSFMIESQRFPDYEWRPVARGITGNSHRVTGLQPKQDYYFRIRGETPYGLTEPSSPVTLYRRPVLSGVPIARPSVWHDEPYGARLRWSNVYIPSYKSSPSLSYIIEMQEPPRQDWTPIARDITAHEYQVRDLSPRKDYMFRIRASDPSGDISRPTPPIPYYKSTRLSYEPLVTPESLLLHEDYSVPNRPYIDSLTVKVPPRLTIEKPTMYQSSPEAVQLTWHAARVPAATATLSRTTYRVEMRPQDCFDWREAASGIVGTTTSIKDLHPYLDYAFRIRAVNDFGYSEPTLPVFLNRPLDQRPGAVDEDDDFDFGIPISETVAPKLPIDTPRMINTSPESVRLSWNPARIPVYAKSTPITYTLEVKEAPSGSWRDLIGGIPEVFYEVKNLVPTQDYHFRVRAENEYGTSEPTFHAVLSRAKPMERRRPSVDKDDRATSPKTPTYIDSLMTGVPPRTPTGRPSINDVKDDHVTLNWQPARMPSYLRQTKVSYIVEQREPPNHLWSVIAEDVPETSYKVHGLDPEQDYMFRVRGQNEFGTSDPTLPASLTRERDDPSARGYRGRSSSRARSPSVSPSPHLGQSARRLSFGQDDDYYEGIPIAPDFILPKDNTQYGVEGGTAKIAMQLRGNPLPVCMWYFNGEKIIYGDRYNPITAPNGQVILEFSDMGWPDIGEYKCVAENDHGVAEKTINLQMADPPTIVEPLVEMTLTERGHGKLVCRVDGFPAPSIKWSKDWRPLAETSRIFTTKEAPDTWTLTINNAMSIDEGQYMCTAENVAGKVQCSARVTVEDTLPAKEPIDFKESPHIEDEYYILEELGRGRHGIVNRAIKKSTGDVYAAKFVRIRDDTEKDFFRPELETSRQADHKNLLSLHDAFETPKQLILVNDLLTGGPLLDRIVKSGNFTENGAAFYVRQLLEGLKPLHQLNIAHLDVKPANLMFTCPSTEDIRLIDFGFAKKLQFTKDNLFNCGTPEFASPEQIDHEPISLASDMWSVGVLSYILLSGISPFRKDTIRDTLIKTVDCDWEFDPVAFSKICPDAKDFISKLLVLDPEARMTVDECLDHPWIKNATDRTGGAKIDLTKLKAYQSQQPQEAPVRTVANLYSLSKLMEGTPLDGGLHPEVDPKTGKISFPGSESYGEFLDEESWYDWQMRQQPGHESELFPARDTDYSLRIRGYRRQATREESFDLDDDVYEGEDYGTRAPAVRERRLLSDVEKETLPPSLEKEMAWIAEMREKRPKDSDEISIASKRSSLGSVSAEGFPGPIFKAKLEDMAVGVGETVTLCCHMMGPPMPSAAWYHDEEFITDGARTKTGVCSDGRAYLTINNIKPYDAGTYKCVARNKYGRLSCRCRLLIGDCPDRTGRPIVSQVSSTEALVIWDSPKSLGGAGLLYYRVDYKKEGAEKWKTGAKVTTECAVVTGLEPATSYRFRVCGVNEFGPSPFSWGSVQVTTKPSGTPAMTFDPEFDLRLLRSRQSEPLPPPPSRWEVPEVDEGDLEAEAELKKTKPEDVYNLGDVIWKGQFSKLQQVSNPTTEQELVMRVVPLTKDSESDRLREFNILKGIHHNHVGHLVAGFQTDKDLSLVLEKMTGDNIARHLAFKCRYNEETAVYVLRQVIDALQFLHRHGCVHLNLQPGSVMMHNRQSLNIKLVDFSLARKISPEGEVVPRMGYPDFMPPEIVNQEKVNFSADVWGVGVLAFLLLSGQSAFSSDTDDQTLANVAYNRYNANDLYENVSKEGLRFIFKVLKRVPRNRPSLAECLEMKWMLQADSMIKSRAETWFMTNNIRKFADEYDRCRQSDKFRYDYSKVDLTVKKPVESKRVRKEKRPAEKMEDKSQRESKEKKASAEKKTKKSESDAATSESEATKSETEAPKAESEAAKTEHAGEKMERVADDVVSKALEEAMQSSELGSA